MAYKDVFSGYDIIDAVFPLDTDVYLNYEFNKNTGVYSVSDPTKLGLVQYGVCYQPYMEAGDMLIDTRKLRQIERQLTVGVPKFDVGTRTAVFERDPIEHQEGVIVAGHGDHNIITKDHVALARDFIFGNNYGVMSGFNADIQSGTQGMNAVNLDAGLLFAYGYVAMLPEPVTFNYLLPSVEQYWVIYGEIDMSRVPNEFTIKTKNSGRSQNVSDESRWRQDVLSSIKTGVFQMPLWRVKLTAEGIEELTDVRLTLNNINHAKYTDSAKVGTGVISAGKRYKDVYDYENYTGGSNPEPNLMVSLGYTFDSITGVYSPQGELTRIDKLEVDTVCYNFEAYENNRQIEEYKIQISGLTGQDVLVAYRTHTATLLPVEAVTQDLSDSSEKVATTEFVHNLFDKGEYTNLEYKNIRTNITDSAKEGWIARKYNFVIGRIFLKGYMMAENGLPIATLPEAYRPKENKTWRYAGYSGANFSRNTISITIKTNGDIITSGTIEGFYIALNFGYKIGG